MATSIPIPRSGAVPICRACGSPPLFGHIYCPACEQAIRKAGFSGQWSVARVQGSGFSTGPAPARGGHVSVPTSILAASRALTRRCPVPAPWLPGDADLSIAEQIGRARSRCA